MENNNKIIWHRVLKYCIAFIADVCTIITFFIYTNIIKLTNEPIIEPENENSQQYVESIQNEIELLNNQLLNISTSEEYIIKNDEGYKIDLTKAIDYHHLISEMEKASSYYYFIDLISFMKETGYDVEDENIGVLTQYFFSMSYEEQANILSQMFIPETDTYKVATDYAYTADVTTYPDGTIEYSNIKATATNIEEWTVPINI
jgi:hypothetical protein